MRTRDSLQVDRGITEKRVVGAEKRLDSSTSGEEGDDGALVSRALIRRLYT